MNVIRAILLIAFAVVVYALFVENLKLLLKEQLKAELEHEMEQENKRKIENKTAECEMYKNAYNKLKNDTRVIIIDEKGLSKKYGGELFGWGEKF